MKELQIQNAEHLCHCPLSLKVDFLSETKIARGTQNLDTTDLKLMNISDIYFIDNMT